MTVRVDDQDPQPAPCASSTQVPAYQGREAELPVVPLLPSRPVRDGDDYTVAGAVHHLNSRVHASEVRDKELTIVGYIVETNFDDVPLCAVHRTGMADPDGCKTYMPTFWIADDPTGAGPRIKVTGFASNFAQIYDAIVAERRGSTHPVFDEFLGLPLPSPVPGSGARVRVKGSYGTRYTKAMSGIESDPVYGILTCDQVTYLRPPTTPASLPGM